MLVTFDVENVKRVEYETTTPFLITNVDDYFDIFTLEIGNIDFMEYDLKSK